MFQRKTTMANMKETAMAYQPPQTKNIADLDMVNTDVEVLKKTVNEGTADEFSYNYILVEDVEYRVPNSVIKQVKAQLEANPDLTTFQVKKSGEGLKTEYTVIPRV